MKVATSRRLKGVEDSLMEDGEERIEHGCRSKNNFNLLPGDLS